VQNGVPLLTVKEWLGHSTIAVTQRYAHLAPMHLMEAAKRIP
jgi:integrase/recombinase XerD